jgi:hypothetical protein
VCARACVCVCACRYVCVCMCVSVSKVCLKGMFIMGLGDPHINTPEYFPDLNTPRLAPQLTVTNLYGYGEV